MFPNQTTAPLNLPVLSLYPYFPRPFPTLPQPTAFSTCLPFPPFPTPSSPFSPFLYLLHSSPVLIQGLARQGENEIEPGERSSSSSSSLLVPRANQWGGPGAALRFPICPSALDLGRQCRLKPDPVLSSGSTSRTTNTGKSRMRHGEWRCSSLTTRLSPSLGSRLFANPSAPPVPPPSSVIRWLLILLSYWLSLALVRLWPFLALSGLSPERVNAPEKAVPPQKMINP